MFHLKNIKATVNRQIFVCFVFQIHFTMFLAITKNWSVTSEFVEPIASPLERLKREPPAFLRLATDAPEQHIVVDDIGEIPADGTSFCTITVEKVTSDGTIMTGKEHKDELFLRKTGGFLMDDKRKKRIRSLKLKSGKAGFRLVSEKHPKIVTVTVFGREPIMFKAEIKIEFV